MEKHLHDASARCSLGLFRKSFVSAITLGMRQAPFYPEIIASDQSISGLSAIMPMINMSDAAPAKVNEAETIPLGDVSFGQKSVSLFKNW